MIQQLPDTSLTGWSRRPCAVSKSNPSETPEHRKLRKSAQEFESLLISQLLGDFASGLSSLPGDSAMAGAGTLNALAVETLSGAIAGQGGFGIANMLVHHLEPSLHDGK